MNIFSRRIFSWYPNLIKKISNKSRKHRLSLVEMSILILLAAILVYLFTLNRNLASLRHAFETGNIQEKKAMPKVPAVTIAKLQPGAMVLANNIAIEGEAEDQQVITLTMNGEITQVALSQNGKFSFANVMLTPGQNQVLVRAIDSEGKMVTLEEITVTYGTPMMKYLAQDFKRGRLVEKKIALTFDGGAEDNATSEILDYLSEKNVKCTIFLTGDFIRRYPEQVKRIVRDGHEVGNHTTSHPHLTSFAVNRRHDTLPYVTGEFLERELRETERLFKRTTGQEMIQLWRAPYGEHNYAIRQMAAALGYRQISWTYGPNHQTMDTMDWVADPRSDIYLSAEEIMQRILNFGQNDSSKANGAIVLMHLGTQRTSDQAHKILPALVDSLHARGYDIVKVSEIL